MYWNIRAQLWKIDRKNKKVLVEIVFFDVIKMCFCKSVLDDEKEIALSSTSSWKPKFI